jgi:hypothetical protein
MLLLMKNVDKKFNEFYLWQNFAMQKFKSLKARIFYRLLTSEPLNYRLGYIKGGSHKTLVAKGRLPIIFSWHSGDEISGNRIRKVLIERAQLSEVEAFKLVHKIK